MPKVQVYRRSRRRRSVFWGSVIIVKEITEGVGKYSVEGDEGNGFLGRGCPPPNSGVVW